MTGAEHTLEWLEHRAGLRKLSCHPRPHFNRALELNDDKGAAFTAAYGNKEIKGFVGFVDLIGFSTKVAGLSPSGMSQYLKPFLVGVTEKAVQCGALVDKTIGDEVMFILPDTKDDGGSPGILEMRFLMTLLHDFQRELGPQYPFRIGISYGVQFVDRIEGKGYTEWTVVGESVNLAKRLHTLPGAEPDDNIGGAFGVLVNETSEQMFMACLGHMAGFGLPMTHRVVEGAVQLKGISSARCAILTPKVPSSKWQPGMRLD
jgi:class 3 adenylate cyclase